jgi:glycosyltransferase involved in cell wall biosynthesis
MSPEWYKEKAPGTNFLFTMFEGNTIPDQYRKFMDKADYFLTPSAFVKDLFDRYYPPEKTFVINHGVERDFTFKKRKFPNINVKPFRFLWVGAHNPRKGFEEVIHTWKALFEKHAGLELYIKTTNIKGVQKKKNVILDGRDLSKRDLVKLYHSSHCFLFPSRGEGFGLTLAEAMRTGLPCIGTDYSGQKDFFDEKVGYPIGYKMGKGIMKFLGDGEEEETDIAFPLVDQLSERMVEVVTDYKTALKKGVLASRRISARFTWPLAAQKLVKIISEYGED